ncbi:MAG TPA: NAD(P)-dependent alcohol dehydrogenase [Polyangiaceae bacterium]|nr:NAD(P)-dependent alcohol dehydrogenase [Polyangiaceae bacterium]
MTETKGYATTGPTAPLGPFSLKRREPRANDVQIDILYCGVCHSDLHTARNEWKNTVYPCVPGHEIIGRVARAGSGVRKVKAGDLVGVGCMVDSCRGCGACEGGLQQFCERGATFTYNSPEGPDGGVTYGGYAQSIVVDEAFVLRVSEKLDPAAAAPLLCAGITTYSPLRHWKVSKGQTVGIVGLGGLGHMGLKFANAFGARVVLFTSSPGKAEDAKRLGAHEVVVSKDPAAMKAQQNRFDFILDTVSADHDVNAYVSLLRRDGTLVLVGAPEKPLPLASFSLIFGRRSLAGSLIGGIEETQEMLDFCAERGITSDVEVIAASKINEAYERMLKSDVKYRFVIDAASFA